MKKSAGIILSALLAVGSTALAQEANEADQEIVVSASRDYREACQIPANVTVLTAADIDQAGTVTVVDALKNLAGVYFRTTSGDASQAQITMRGFGENSHGRVLVLLDGRRLNRPDMAGINWCQIPLNNIERVEILRGSHSVLYGDHAIGGVVNIVTRKGTPTPEYSVSAMGGSYGMNIQRLGVSGSSGPLSYAANAERNQSSGYRDRSAYLAWGGGGNLGYDINERNNVALALSYDTIDYQIPGYLTKDEMDENPRQSMYPDDSAKNHYYNADLGLKSLWDDMGRLDINVVYRRKKISSDMTSWSSFSDFTIDTYGATPRFSMDTDLFNHQNTFLIGFDGYLDKLDADRYSDEPRTSETATAAIKKRTLGGYAKNEFSISEELVLDLGARLEQARFDADVSSAGIDDDTVYNANALAAALIYLLPEDSKAFARAGTVYRYPFVDELVSYVGYGSDDMYTDINMEKGQNYEVGTDLAVRENLRMGLTLFLLNMKDEIAWNSATYRNENLDNTRHMGAEANAAWTFRDVCRLDTWYTYAQARFTKGDYDGNDVPLVPNHKVSVEAKWFLPFDLSLNAAFTYIGKQYLGSDNSNTGEKLADYTVVDLGVRYVPEGADRLDLEVFAGVDNVFGKHYATAGYQGWSTDGYYPSPDRTYKAGVSCRF
ncbi:TonB-dependent receptor [Verrucomicrobiota bacterium]